MRNLWISIGVILSSSYLFYDTFNIEDTGNSVIGPADWPRLLTLFLFIFGIIMFIQSVNEIKKITKETEQEQGDLRKYWFLLIVTVFYIPATLLVGFILATPLAIFLLALIIGMRKIKQLIVAPVLGTVVIVYIFIILLQISMPRGVGVMRDFSLLFY